MAPRKAVFVAAALLHDDLAARVSVVGLQAALDVAATGNGQEDFGGLGSMGQAVECSPMAGDCE